MKPAEKHYAAKYAALQAPNADRIGQITNLRWKCAAIAPQICRRPSHQAKYPHLERAGKRNTAIRRKANRPPYTSAKWRMKNLKERLHPPARPAPPNVPADPQTPYAPLGILGGQASRFPRPVRRHKAPALLLSAPPATPIPAPAPRRCIHPKPRSTPELVHCPPRRKRSPLYFLVAAIYTDGAQQTPRPGSTLSGAQRRNRAANSGPPPQEPRFRPAQGLGPN